MADDIDTLTPEQLDEAIAIEVMGWHQVPGSPMAGWWDDELNSRCHAVLWCPSTNIVQAMEAVEKIGRLWNLMRMGQDDWLALAPGEYDGQGDLASIAICRAALRWARSKA